VALHFNGDGSGGDVVVLTGDAAQAPDSPAPHENPAYLAKYGDAMTRVGGSPAEFAEQYPIALRVRVGRIRGF
jgi:hypothetical protein